MEPMGDMLNQYWSQYVIFSELFPFRDLLSRYAEERTSWAERA